MIGERRVDPRSVVGHLDFDRQFHRPPEAKDVEDEPADETGSYGDRRRLDRAARVARVGDQVDENLHQRAFVG